MPQISPVSSRYLLGSAREAIEKFSINPELNKNLAQHIIYCCRKRKHEQRAIAGPEISRVVLVKCLSWLILLDLRPSELSFASDQPQPQYLLDTYCLTENRDQ